MQSPSTEVLRPLLPIIAILIYSCGEDSNPTKPETVKPIAIYTLSAGDYNDTDCTAAIQNALNNYTIVIIPYIGDGTWRTSQLRPKSNQEILIDAGVKIQGKKGGFPIGDDTIFRLEQVDNVIIRGASYNNKARIEFIPYNEYTNDERRHAISMFTCNKVTIDNVYIKYTYGDGIFIGDENKGISPFSSKNITVMNSVIEEASRNGIAVNSVDGLQILNCLIKNTQPINQGVAAKGPWAGIDLEPDVSEHKLGNIVIKDCDFINNKTDAILIEGSNLGAAPISVVVDRARIESSGQCGFFVKSLQQNTTGSILFINGVVSNTQCAAITVRDKAKNGASVEFRDLTISQNCLGGSTAEYNDAPLVVYKRNDPSEPVFMQTDGNIKFTNIFAQDNARKVNIFRAKGLNDNYKVDGVNGNIRLGNTDNGGLWLTYAANINITLSR